MKRIICLIVTMSLLVSCISKEEKIDKEVETNEKEGWIVLFDGSNFDNWKGYLKEEMPNEWSIDGDAMMFKPGDEKANIVTRQKFKNFILELEWKIAEGGNSGVFYSVVENENYSEPYSTGPEIQVIDNLGHPDANVNPKYHQAGALYDMVQPTSDVCNQAGEWNKMRIKIDYGNNEGNVNLNGVEIAKFPVKDDDWDELVKNSKFKDWESFGKMKTGHIGLQDHGDKVWYRNIRIKELPKAEDTEFYEPVPPIISVNKETRVPSDAIVLFDGSNFNEWSYAEDSTAVDWILNPDKSMTVKNKSGDIQTNKNFGSMQLHIEWKSPLEIQESGQARGNSGVFIQNRYEVQILDNNDNDTYVNGQVGSIYKQSIPLVKASMPSGEWNSYDIIYRAPKFDENGDKTNSATITVLHNGVLIQDHYVIKGTTEYFGEPKNIAHGKAPIKLQDHGDNSRVSFRNIWVRELD